MPESRLLIVDDETAVRLPLERFFAGRGFDVASAGTVAEARDRFRAAPADVVLLGFALPDGTGLELLRQIKAADPLVAELDRIQQT